MSIPRTAIERPVTMFMISAVIVLLGAISLIRLPVDLLPDLSFPSLTVRVSYPGVGPREIEETITRPIEQTVAAVSGLDQLNSTSSEGSSRVTLNFVWGTDLGEAADDLRSRIDRIRGRLPEDADPPVIFKFDSNAWPIMTVAVQGEMDPVTLREMAERTLAQRLERVNGVASVTVLHRDCMMADGWATALTVLGPDAAIALADVQGLAACVVAGDREHVSRAWRAMLD